MPRPLVVAVAALAGLLAAAPAAAHVVATPPFVASESSASIALSAPNERDDPMTAFSVTAPSGLEIEHAHNVSGWTPELEGSTATWVGGSLGSGEDASFGVTLKAVAEPGLVELQAEQRYADGVIVTWPVAITVLPANESPSQNVVLAGVVGLLGTLVVVAIAVLAWRRRSPPS